MQLYEHVTDDSGQLKYRPVTQSRHVRLSLTIKMVNVIRVSRKVILYPDEMFPHHYVVIDFQMSCLPPQRQVVVVPFHPEKNDMVLVLGENDAQWIAKTVSVQSDDKTV